MKQELGLESREKHRHSRAPIYSFLQPTKLRGNYALPWVIVFLIMSLAISDYGGTNAFSRYALLQSIVDYSTFSIDEFSHWTVDWSSSPSGRLYSNKPPGPALLSSPIYWVVDRVTKNLDQREFDDSGKVLDPIGERTRHFFNFICQVLPFALVVLFITDRMQKELSWSAVTLFTVTLLFCTTPVLFMTTFFGHGLAAIFSILCFFYLINRSYFWCGLYFGLTLLCDFGGAFLLPAIVIYFVLRERWSLIGIKNFLCGGLLPGLLWIWYHTAAYGNPFITSIQYPNPELLIDTSITHQFLGGMFTLLPNWAVLIELVLGAERGILFTQPWILVLSFALLIRWRESKNPIPFELKLRFVIVLTCLSLLLWMNSTFFGWHGGWTAGPRYLSVALPLFCFILAWSFGYLSDVSRASVVATVCVTLLFRGQVYATTALVPEGHPLWVWQWYAMFRVLDGVSSVATILCFLLLLVAALLWSIRMRVLK